MDTNTLIMPVANASMNTLIMPIATAANAIGEWGGIDDSDRDYLWAFLAKGPDDSFDINDPDLCLFAEVAEGYLDCWFFLDYR